MQTLRQFVFRYWEISLLRNLFYTIVFMILLPTGGRFAFLAWKDGTAYDRFLVVSGGLLMGVIAVITLLRFWTVAPTKTSGGESAQETPNELRQPSVVAVLASKDYRRHVDMKSAANRELGASAAALGSTRRKGA